MDFQFEVYPSTTFDYEDMFTRKRKPGERLKPGPRPTKRPRKYQPRKAPTRLRKDRPLQTQISHDIWENILIFCPLDKLLKLRGLCKTFYSTLSSDRVWKQARLNQFGSTLPDPPDGMTEMEYADLLVAVGCHSSGCSEKCTRRTYWAFRRRWCERCCVVNLTKERLAREQIEEYPLSKNCIPYAMYDSWNHYQWAGTYDQPPTWTGTYGAQTQCYSRFDIKRWNDRYNEFMESRPSAEATETWFATQRKNNEAYMEQLQKIESWVMEDVKKREAERQEVRALRSEFFKEKAAQLQPAFPEEVLELCPSYEKSAAISKLPSEKSWHILRDKVLREREKAEIQLGKRKREQYHQHYRVYLAEQYDHTRTNRRTMKTKEQYLVLELADQVIHNILVDPDGIADSDIVNVILRRVYDAYQKVPDEKKPSIRPGKYRLIMDDARLVYRKRIVPLLRCFTGEARRNDAKRLCCPYSACEGKDNSFLDFEHLMDHIGRIHPRVKNLEYLAMSFHMINNREEANWFCLEWPRNLPMRPDHQPARVEWDLDTDDAYKTTSNAGSPLLEAFAEAVESEPSYKQCAGGDPAMDTILQAAFLVGKLKLDAQYKTNVALEFIRSRRSRAKASDLMLPDTERLLADAQFNRLFKPHHCVRCRNRSAYSYYSFSTHSFIDLLKHYYKEHMTTNLDEKPYIQVPELVKIEDEDSDEASTSVQSTPTHLHHGLYSSSSGSDDEDFRSTGEEFPVIRRFINPESRILPQPWASVLGSGSF